MRISILVLVVALGLVSSQGTYNMERRVHANNQLFCDDGDITMYFDKDALNKRHREDGYNNRKYRVYFYGQRNTPGCFMNETFNINFRLNNPNASTWANYDMDMFNYTWCSEKFDNGIFLNHSKCMKLDFTRFNIQNYTSFNQSWCNQKYEMGIFLAHPFCQYNYSRYNMSNFNASWCMRDYENGTFTRHPRCKRFFDRFNLTNFNQTWCKQDFEEGFFMDHYFCQVNFTQVNSTWCYRNYDMGRFMYHPRCQEFFRLNLKNFNDSWCKEDFRDGLFMDHHFCRQNSTQVKSTWCNRNYEMGRYMMHPRCQRFFNFFGINISDYHHHIPMNFMQLNRFNESWCMDSFEEGLFMDHPFCQQNFTRVNSTWCNMNFMDGKFMNHPRCKRFFDYNMKQFNRSWCNESFEGGLFMNHPFCRYNFSQINSTWCYRNFMNGTFMNHPRCQRFFSYNVRQFNESWCNMSFEDGLFMDHPFCQFNFTQVNATWCSRKFMDGKFMNHPRCQRFFSLDFTTNPINYTLWCTDRHENGLMVDHPLCKRYDNSTDLSRCDPNYENGAYLRSVRCLGFYKDYDFSNFSVSWCNKSYNNGTWMKHPICTQRLYRYNLTNFNRTWCRQSYENSIFKNYHPTCHILYSKYQPNINFNVSWCSENFAYGIFIDNYRCQEVYSDYDFNQFNDSWCSRSYEYGIFRRHPRCQDTLRRENTNFNHMVRYNNSVFIRSNYDQCGINVFYGRKSEYIIFNQTIVVVYGQNPQSGQNLIQREEYDYYNFMCKRNRTVIEKLFGGGYFNTTHRLFGEKDKNQTRSFDFTFTHTDMNGKRQAIYELGDYIKFKLESHTILNVKAVVQQCWTTSDGSKNKKYMIIDNRCIKDGSTFWMSQNRSMTQFKVEAFRYLGENKNAIYMECAVRMCVDNDNKTNCQYCPDSKNVRNRRNVDETSLIHDENVRVVKSPVFYIIDARQSPKDTQSESSSIMSGTNGTVIIILISAIVFIALLLIVKKLFFTPAAVPATHLNGFDNKAVVLETIKQA